MPDAPWDERDFVAGGPALRPSRADLRRARRRVLPRGGRVVVGDERRPGDGAAPGRARVLPARRGRARPARARANGARAGRGCTRGRARAARRAAVRRAAGDGRRRARRRRDHAHDRRPASRRRGPRAGRGGRCRSPGLWAAGVDAGGVATGGYASGLAQAPCSAWSPPSRRSPSSERNASTKPIREHDGRSNRRRRATRRAAAAVLRGPAPTCGVSGRTGRTWDRVVRSWPRPSRARAFANGGPQREHILP